MLLPLSFVVLQLISCILLLNTLEQYCQQRKYTIIFRVFAIAFLSMQVFSILIGDSFIDYKFYSHAKFSVVSKVFGFFIDDLPQYLLIFLPVLAVYFLIDRLHQKFFTRVYGIVGTLLSFSVLCMPQGILYNLYQVADIHFSPKTEFRESLKNLDFEVATMPSQIKAKPGKNIICIFLESIEKEFLNEELAHLTPNIRRLSESMHFYDMEQVDGAHFTISALYTYFTGIPMFFKNKGDNVFVEAGDFNLSSVPAVLEHAGYQQVYLAGKPAFAGTGNMFRSMADVDIRSEAQYQSEIKKIALGATRL